MLKTLRLLLCFVLTAQYCFGQSSNVNSINDQSSLIANNRPLPVVQTMLRFEPSAYFGDTNTSFKFSQVRIDANVPLFFFQGKKGVSHTVGLGLGVRYSLPNASFMWRFHEVYSFNSNINYTILKPGKFIWINTLGTGLADDNYTIDNPNIRLLLSSIYERAISDRLKVRAGGVLASINRSQLFVPMFALQWKVNKQLNFFAGYPYNFRLSYRYNKSWQWYASCHRRNETFRISSYNEDFPNESASVYLTKSDFPTGIGFKHHFSSAFLLTCEAGALLNRDLYFYNRYEFPRIKAKGVDAVALAPIQLNTTKSLYFEVSLRYIIPSRKAGKDRMSPNARVLQILDPSDADLEDIIIQH